MVTFKKPIGSISVSGHKFVGSPVPCGVVMTRLRCATGAAARLLPGCLRAAAAAAEAAGACLPLARMPGACLPCSLLPASRALPLPHPSPLTPPVPPRSYLKGVSNDVEYLNSRDATIMGSRNGHAPIYMW